MAVIFYLPRIIRERFAECRSGIPSLEILNRFAEFNLKRFSIDLTSAYVYRKRPKEKKDTFGWKIHRTFSFRVVTRVRARRISRTQAPFPLMAKRRNSRNAGNRWK